MITTRVILITSRNVGVITNYTMETTPVRSLTSLILRRHYHNQYCCYVPRQSTPLSCSILPMTEQRRYNRSLQNRYRRSFDSDGERRVDRRKGPISSSNSHSHQKKPIRNEKPKNANINNNKSNNKVSYLLPKRYHHLAAVGDGDNNGVDDISSLRRGASWGDLSRHREGEGDGGNRMHLRASSTKMSPERPLETKRKTGGRGAASEDNDNEQTDQIPNDDSLFSFLDPKTYTDHNEYEADVKAEVVRSQDDQAIPVLQLTKAFYKALAEASGDEIDSDRSIGDDGGLFSKMAMINSQDADDTVCGSNGSKTGSGDSQNTLESEIDLLDSDEDDDAVAEVGGDLSKAAELAVMGEIIGEQSNNNSHQQLQPMTDTERRNQERNAHREFFAQYYLAQGVIGVSQRLFPSNEGSGPDQAVSSSLPEKSIVSAGDHQTTLIDVAANESEDRAIQYAQEKFIHLHVNGTTPVPFVIDHTFPFVRAAVSRQVEELQQQQLEYSYKGGSDDVINSNSSQYVRDTLYLPETPSHRRTIRWYEEVHESPIQWTFDVGCDVFGAPSVFVLLSPSRRIMERTSNTIEPLSESTSKAYIQLSDTEECSDTSNINTNSNNGGTDSAPHQDEEALHYMSLLSLDEDPSHLIEQHPNNVSCHTSESDINTPLPLLSTDRQPLTTSDANIHETIVPSIDNTVTPSNNVSTVPTSTGTVNMAHCTITQTTVTTKEPSPKALQWLERMTASGGIVNPTSYGALLLPLLLFGDRSYSDPSGMYRSSDTSLPIKPRIIADVHPNIQWGLSSGMEGLYHEVAKGIEGGITDNNGGDSYSPYVFVAVHDRTHLLSNGRPPGHRNSRGDSLIGKGFSSVSPWSSRQGATNPMNISNNREKVKEFPSGTFLPLASKSSSTESVSHKGGEPSLSFELSTRLPPFSSYSTDGTAPTWFPRTPSIIHVATSPSQHSKSNNSNKSHFLPEALLAACDGVICVPPSTKDGVRRPTIDLYVQRQGDGFSHGSSDSNVAYEEYLRSLNSGNISNNTDNIYNGAKGNTIQGLCDNYPVCDKFMKALTVAQKVMCGKQLQLLKRAMVGLKIKKAASHGRDHATGDCESSRGGRVVYMTTSHDPHQNEAIIALALCAMGTAKYRCVNVRKVIESGGGVVGVKDLCDREALSFPSLVPALNEWHAVSLEGEESEDISDRTGATKSHERKGVADVYLRSSAQFEDVKITVPHLHMERQMRGNGVDGVRDGLDESLQEGSRNCDGSISSVIPSASDTNKVPLLVHIAENCARVDPLHDTHEALFIAVIERVEEEHMNPSDTQTHTQTSPHINGINALNETTIGNDTRRVSETEVVQGVQHTRVDCSHRIDTSCDEKTSSLHPTTAKLSNDNGDNSLMTVPMTSPAFTVGPLVTSPFYLAANVAIGNPITGESYGIVSTSPTLAVVKRLMGDVTGGKPSERTLSLSPPYEHGVIAYGIPCSIAVEDTTISDSIGVVSVGQRYVNSTRGRDRKDSKGRGSANTTSQTIPVIATGVTSLVEESLHTLAIGDINIEVGDERSNDPESVDASEITTLGQSVSPMEVNDVIYSSIKGITHASHITPQTLLIPTFLSGTAVLDTLLQSAHDAVTCEVTTSSQEKASSSYISTLECSVSLPLHYRIPVSITELTTLLYLDSDSNNNNAGDNNISRPYKRGDERYPQYYQRNSYYRNNRNTYYTKYNNVIAPWVLRKLMRDPPPGQQAVRNAIHDDVLYKDNGGAKPPNVPLLVPTALEWGQLMYEIAEKLLIIIRDSEDIDHRSKGLSKRKLKRKNVKGNKNVFNNNNNCEKESSSPQGSIGTLVTTIVFTPDSVHESYPVISHNTNNYDTPSLHPLLYEELKQCHFICHVGMQRPSGVEYKSYKVVSGMSKNNNNNNVTGYNSNTKNSSFLQQKRKLLSFQEALVVHFGEVVADRRKSPISYTEVSYDNNNDDNEFSKGKYTENTTVHPDSDSDGGDKDNLSNNNNNNDDDGFTAGALHALLDDSNLDNYSSIKGDTTLTGDHSKPPSDSNTYNNTNNKVSTSSAPLYPNHPPFPPFLLSFEFPKQYHNDEDPSHVPPPTQHLVAARDALLYTLESLNRSIVQSAEASNSPGGNSNNNNSNYSQQEGLVVIPQYPVQKSEFLWWKR